MLDHLLHLLNFRQGPGTPTPCALIGIRHDEAFRVSCPSEIVFVDCSRDRRLAWLLVAPLESVPGAVPTLFRAGRAERSSNLVLSRRPGESTVIRGAATVTYMGYDHGHASLAFAASRDVIVVRTEKLLQRAC